MKTAAAEPVPPSILLIEDNPAHAELVLRSFEVCRSDIKIVHLADGEAALDYLFRRGHYADPHRSPRPRIILLDLRLPRVNGLQVLAEIKSYPDIKQIPVIILTTSAAESDIMSAYERHANSYLVKPAEFEELIQLVEALGKYWLDWNSSPTR